MSLPLNLAAFLSLLPSVFAQCPQWSSSFASSGVEGEVLAFTSHDAGQGPELYLGGDFQRARDGAASRVARWDGAHFHEVGAGLNNTVRALASFQGSLYAAGDFTASSTTTLGRIARFDGIAWQPIGTFDNRVYGLEVFGGELYAAGAFDQLDGTLMHKFARFDGTNWHDVGGGIIGTGAAFELATIDLGVGPQLYAAGNLPGRVVRFDGSAWTALQGTMQSTAWSLARFDGFGGPKLFAGFAGGGSSQTELRWWNGANWIQVPGGPIGNRTRDLLVHDDGSGPQLYAAGPLTLPGSSGPIGVMRWDGATWTVPNSAPYSAKFSMFGEGARLFAFDDGSGNGNELWVGGDFQQLFGIAAENIARWNGGTWRAVGQDLGIAHATAASPTFHHGLGTWTAPGQHRPSIVIGGQVANVHGVAVSNLAAFDGHTWSDLGGGVDGPVWDAQERLDPTSGSPALFVGGQFANAGGISALGVARFDGTSWSALDAGIDGSAFELLDVADPALGGPAVFVTGSFLTGSGRTLNSIARFDGTSLLPLGLGINPSGSSPASGMALATYDDPATPEGLELYVAGAFLGAGGLTSPYCARWDGTSWREASTGLNQATMGGNARDLALWDDGSGAGTRLYLVSGSGRLYVRTAGAWVELSTQAGPLIMSMTVFDDGSGAALYGGGHRWSGTSWSASAQLGGATSFVSNVLTARDPFTGRETLWMYGRFSSVDGTFSDDLAQFSDPCAALTSYCTAKTNSQGCAPAIGWSGEPSRALVTTTPFVIDATQIVNQKSGLLFYSTNGRRSAPFQGGTLCVAAPLRRTPIVSSGGNTGAPDCSGTLALDFSPWIAGTQDPSLSVGQVVDAQWWYRDPASASTTGLSNAIEFEVRWKSSTLRHTFELCPASVQLTGCTRGARVLLAAPFSSVAPASQNARRRLSFIDAGCASPRSCAASASLRTRSISNELGPRDATCSARESRVIELNAPWAWTPSTQCRRAVRRWASRLRNHTSHRASSSRRSTVARPA